ncbi:MAG TPA: phosphoglucomutase/phosphomannomutase family protein [Limnochordales bacterium]
MAPVRFGTDGWRAILAEEFTFRNVRRVSQAIAGYLQESGWARREVLVGYDTRFMAERFASTVAEVLAGNGIAVGLSPAEVPTPALAYGVLERRAAGAVMVTASHNPPEYLGLKFIPHYGGPALSDVTAAIEHHLQELDRQEREGHLAVQSIPLDQARRQGLLESVDLRGGYLEHLMAVARGAYRPRRAGEVVYDAMHGAGARYAPGALESLGLRVQVLRAERDPLFGGGAPEPVEHHLQGLREAVARRSGVLGLATDGDADRFGVVDEGGRFLSANQVLALVADYLLRQRGMRGALVRTVATTHLLDRLAVEFSVPLRETPVGFKHVGAVMRSEPVVLGGEESGGLSIAGHIPEKDGILAITLVALIWNEAGRPLSSLLEEIYSRHGRWESRRVDLPVSEAARDRVLERLRLTPPEQCAGLKVERVTVLDGVKVVLEDGSWWLVRASGTEPVVRIYLEAPSASQLDRLEQDVRQRLQAR